MHAITRTKQNIHAIMRIRQMEMSLRDLRTHNCKLARQNKQLACKLTGPPVSEAGDSTDENDKNSDFTFETLVEEMDYSYFIHMSSEELHRGDRLKESPATAKHRASEKMLDEFRENYDACLPARHKSAFLSPVSRTVTDKQFRTYFTKNPEYKPHVYLVKVHPKSKLHVAPNELHARFHDFYPDWIKCKTKQPSEELPQEAIDDEFCCLDRTLRDSASGYWNPKMPLIHFTVEVLVEPAHAVEVIEKLK